MFSDILVPLVPMGAELSFGKGHGPVISNTIRSKSDVDKIKKIEPRESLKHVLESVKMMRAELPGDVALIGFAGAPFTLSSYWVEGGKPDPFANLKGMMYHQPETFINLLEKLGEMVVDYLSALVEAGADAVKFQKRTIDLVYTNEFLDSPRESPWGTTQREQKEGLEFGIDDYAKIDKYCKEKGIEWFASAWDLESQDFLNQFDLKHNKIASTMIVYDELLEKVASEEKHTFVSTGMTTEGDISKAVDIFQNANCPFELMHCISTYPMKDEDANLNAIKTLQEKYSCDVGYSGHEVGLAVSYAATALGVTSLERHITLDRAMYGSDQSASVEPSGFRMLVGAVRKIEQAMGDGKLGYLEREIPIAENLRQHLAWEASGLRSQN